MDFFDPIFLVGLIGAIAAGIGTFLIWKTKQQENNRHMRDDYTSEVKKILQIIHEQGHHMGIFHNFLIKEKELGKSVLQHIYSFDENSLDKLKVTLKIIREEQEGYQERRDLNHQEFYRPLNEKYLKLEYVVRPEFGACERCWKFLNKEQQERYSKLKEKEKEFWDYSKF